MKRNPFASRDAEIARLKAELESRIRQPYIAAFANEVGNNIMILLANTPFERWPDMAKTAFRYAQDNQETSAYLYKERLPK